MLWWLSPGEGRDAVGINCKKVQLLKIKAQGKWAMGCILIIVCEYYLTSHDYASLME